MVDLSKVKVAFFDFDDTLCVHRYLNVNRPTRDEWDKAIVTGSKDWYSNTKYCVPQPAIQAFVHTMAKNNVVCHCLTWSELNLLEGARRKFLDEHYDKIIDKIYITGSRDGKLKVMDKYVNLLGYKPEELLLIEDHPVTIDECRKAGYSVLTVSELVMEWSNTVVKELQ